MITKEKIIEILSNYSSYADSSLGNIIQEEKHDIIAEDILSKLRQPPVSSSVCHCNKLPDGEIAISSKALQKPYGDLGQTDC